MSDLFTEALKDSKKLREIAEQDAKNRIMEAITPYIKEMITKESSADFFFEQDEQEEEKPEEEETTEVQAAPADPAENSIDLSGELGVQLGDKPTSAPISVSGEEIVNVSVPDEEGKITVDFEDLFVDKGTVELDKKEVEKLNISSPASTTPEQQVEEPVATEPSQEQQVVEEPKVSNEAITYSEYQRVLSNVSERIDRAFFTESVSDISKETLKHRLFDLLEAVDIMKENGVINGKQTKIQENKLEFLFLKLKEAGLRNNYNKENNNQKDTTDMKSLKEFAAKLFEEDQHAKHAANVSGVDPKLGTRDDIGVAKHGSTKARGCEGNWDEAEPVIDEEDQDKTVKEAVDPDSDEDLEIDVDELKEALQLVNKESVRSRVDKLQEASDGEEAKSWEDGEPEDGEDPSHKKLKEGTDLMEEEDFMDGTEGEADLVLGLDLPPEIEKELAELGLTDDDFSVDVSYNVGDDAPADDDDDDEEIEIVDDEDEEIEIAVDGDEDADSALDDTSSKEEDQLLVDMDEAKYGPQHESRKMKHAIRKNKLLESKINKLCKLVEKKDNDAKELKKQLVETNLFTAKAVYYSKFLQRALNESALNKKVLQQIVEHLDRGKSVAETKAIYNKINNNINEQVGSRKLGGSSSKVAKPGSARNLTEGRAPQAGHDPDSQSADRWKVLAGIKRNTGNE